MSFSTQDKGKYLLIECPHDMDTKLLSIFTTEAVKWEQALKPILFDFSMVETLTESLYRPFVLLQQSLKKKNVGMFTINIMKKEISKQIKMSGLESVFNPKDNVEEALKTLGLTEKKAQIDVGFINPFLNATQKTLEVQANTKITIGKPHLRAEGENLNADIASVITLQSNVFEGSISVCFPSKVFLFIYSNMVGEKHESITKEIADAAGELMNIIFGQAKMELNDKHKYHISKAIPTVVMGNDFQVYHMNRNAAMVLPFETEAGPFYVEISADPVSQG